MASALELTVIVSHWYDGCLHQCSFTLSDTDTRQTPDTPVLPASYRNTAREDGADSDDAVLHHQPGSIIRVKLTNFVTYTSAEFHPGPSLNMVIGPNGTGKSTLVCAICLGLGSKTEVLGRAKDLGDFVKHGAPEAEIEIELARDPSRQRTNPVIRHLIKRAGNKSVWFIDGRTTTRKAVLELCRSFSIQIDNLCQFLPQDRVVEFAALSSTELLRETQRAAAPEYMTQWHDQLKQIRAEQRASLGEHAGHSNNLKNLEGRQNMQRADVDRLRERAEIQEQLTIMKKLRPIPQYNAAQKIWKEASVAYKQANRELTALQREVEPALQAANNKHAYADNISKVVTQRARLVTNLETKSRTLLREQETMVDQIKACEKEVETERDNSKKFKQDRARLETQIRDLKRQIETTNPGTFDFAALNEQNRDLGRRSREKHDLMDAAKEKDVKNESDIASREQRIRYAEKKMDDLRSKAGQQTSKLAQLSSDTARAWHWIQSNREKFSGPVYGPALIECSLKDQRHAKAFEASLGQSDVIALTTTNTSDYNMLQHELLTNMRLSDVHIRSIGRSLSDWNPPVAREQLQTYGLNGYVLDLVEGPEPVLSMLCDNRNIHAMGFSTRDLNNDQYEQLSRSPISSWVTPSESYTITRRREYGEQGVSTRTQRLKNARFFTDQPVDTREEERLRNEKRELQDEIEDLRKRTAEYKEDMSRYSTQIKELNAQMKDLTEEKNQKQKAKNAYDALRPRLDAAEEKLAKAISDAKEFRGRVAAIRQRQEALILERAEESLKLMSSVSSLQKLQTDCFEAELLLLEAQSDYEILQERNEDIHARLAATAAEVGRLRAEEARLKAQARARLNEVNALLQQGEVPEREGAMQEELITNKKTPDEWEAEIEATTARLEMVHEGNPHIIVEYENRAKEIERIRGKIARLDQELGEVEAKITEIRTRWEPELDELVGQISDAFGDNFARMGLAGEVQVAKDEDFENWAIEIKVKFR